MARDTTEIELAIDELLRCAIDHLDSRRRQDRTRVQVINLGDEVARLIEEDVFEIADLLEDPVHAACKRSVYALGVFIGKDMASRDVLLEVATRVAELDLAQADRRLNMLKNFWDGVETQSGPWRA